MLLPVDLPQWRFVCQCWIGLAAVIFAVLQFVRAPYGRHGSSADSPISSRVKAFVGDRWAWFLMELPSPLLMSVFFADGLRHGRVVPATALFFFLFFAHYFNRTVVYPWRLQLRPGAAPSFHLVTLVSGVIFNTVNASLIGHYLFGGLCDARTEYGDTLKAFLNMPNAPLGLVVFLAGAYINTESDERLRALRRQSSQAKARSDSPVRGGAASKSHYSIPRGGLFELVSCANFFGELLEWTGYAVLTWNLGASTFVVFTAANLIPRAVAHHKWYVQHFGDAYPRERRAVIPFLL